MMDRVPPPPPFHMPYESVAPGPREHRASISKDQVVYDGFTLTCIEPETGKKRTWARAQKERMAKSDKELAAMVEKSKKSSLAISTMLASEELKPYKHELIKKILDGHNATERDNDFEWKLVMIRPNYKNKGSKEKITTSIDVVLKRVPRPILKDSTRRRSFGPNAEYVDLKDSRQPFRPGRLSPRPDSWNSDRPDSSGGPSWSSSPVSPFVQDIYPGARPQPQGAFFDPRPPMRPDSRPPHAPVPPPMHPNIEIIHDGPPPQGRPPMGGPIPPPPFAPRPPPVDQPMPPPGHRPMDFQPMGQPPTGPSRGTNPMPMPQHFTHPPPSFPPNEGYIPVPPGPRRPPPIDGCIPIGKDKSKKPKPAKIEVHQQGPARYEKISRDVFESDSEGSSVFDDNATMRTSDTSEIGEERPIKEKYGKQREAGHGEHKRYDSRDKDRQPGKEGKEPVYRVHTRRPKYNDAPLSPTFSEEGGFIKIHTNRPRKETTYPKSPIQERAPLHHRSVSYNSTTYPRPSLQTSVRATGDIDVLKDRLSRLEQDTRDREDRDRRERRARELEIQDKARRLQEMEEHHDERQRVRRLEEIDARMQNLKLEEEMDRAQHYARPAAPARMYTEPARSYAEPLRDPLYPSEREPLQRQDPRDRASFSRGVDRRDSFRDAPRDAYGRDPRERFARDSRDAYTLETREPPRNAFGRDAPARDVRDEYASRVWDRPERAYPHY